MKTGCGFADKGGYAGNRRDSRSRESEEGVRVRQGSAAQDGPDEQAEGGVIQQIDVGVGEEGRKDFGGQRRELPARARRQRA